MRDLRHRLLDTEKQMTRILQAMQDVEEKVTDMSTELSVSLSLCHCAIIDISQLCQSFSISCRPVFFSLLSFFCLTGSMLLQKHVHVLALPVYPSKYGPQYCFEQLR